MNRTWLTAALPLIALGFAYATTETPTLEVNCDDLVSAADLTAAILVSAEPDQLADCRDADDYRDRELEEDDFRYLEGNIFFAYETPWTPTPTGTPTETRTPTLTRTPSTTATVTSTELPSATATPPPTQTSPPASTPTVTQTRTPTQTATPTGYAYRVSGTWFANWGNQICFLDGVPAFRILDTSYIVTAANGRLDVDIEGGDQIARGAEIRADGTIAFRFTSVHSLCPFSGRVRQFVFDYVFLFRPDGTGTATASWNYGVDSFCAVCFVQDSAVLLRTAPPG